MELIHADSSLTELQCIDCFEKFDCEITAGESDSSNDWELRIPQSCWQRMPVLEGHFVYIEGTEWGGIVEKTEHSASDMTVRLYGASWRGMLSRCAVCPDSGNTHFEIAEQDGNDVLRLLTERSGSDLLSAEEGQSGVTCGGRIRYKSLLYAANELFSEHNAHLSVCFKEGGIVLSCEQNRDRSNDIEFSQEYHFELGYSSQSAKYNHIVALGSGTMLERDMLELWLLPDGTITEEAQTGEGEENGGQLLNHNLGTLIYDYSSVDSEETLRDYARKKLREAAAYKEFEISVSGYDAQLELGDVAYVRDVVMDESSNMSVVSKRLTISSNGAAITHTMKG
jgi:hypothetical protein